MTGGAPQPAKASELRLRVASALVLAGLTLTLTALGGVFFRLLAAIIGAAILYEWITMTRSRMDRTHVVLLTSALALVLLALVFGFTIEIQLALLGVGVVLAAVHASFARLGAWGTVGLAYAGLSAVSLAAVRGTGGAGLITILFLFAVVWGTDILAYFVGRRIGGPKLAPKVSPGKTWSGAIGGTIAGILAGLAIWAFAEPVHGLVWFAGLAFVLSATGQIGDLFESWVKRRFSFKDSSRLIPGHGGVMDRVDALVAAAFVLFVVGVGTVGPRAVEHAFFID